MSHEIYAAEALSRYISGMFYALVFVFSLMLIVLILHLFTFGKVATALVVLLLAYFVAIIAILHNFRFIRMREAEIVFTASYQYNLSFESSNGIVGESRVVLKKAGSQEKADTD